MLHIKYYFIVLYIHSSCKKLSIYKYAYKYAI